jgi:hypothetical protein
MAKNEQAAGGKPAAPANMRLWNQLQVTDPAYTKEFDRGGFKGTMIDPTWRMMRMTEIFGPVGQGWGWDELQHVISNDCVFVQVQAWYRDGDAIYKTGPQWGGTELSMKRGKGADARKVPNDEAFKMSATDGLGKCLGSIGVSADVYLGFFDDAKYRVQAAEHYDPAARQQQRQAAENKRTGGKGAGGGRAAQPRQNAENGAAPDDGTFPGDLPSRTPAEVQAWISTTIETFDGLSTLQAIRKGWATVHPEVTALANQDPEAAQEIVNAYQRAVTRCSPPAGAAQ